MVVNEACFCPYIKGWLCQGGIEVGHIASQESTDIFSWCHPTKLVAIVSGRTQTRSRAPSLPPFWASLCCVSRFDSWAWSMWCHPVWSHAKEHPVGKWPDYSLCRWNPHTCLPCLDHWPQSCRFRLWKGRFRVRISTWNYNNYWRTCHLLSPQCHWILLHKLQLIMVRIHLDLLVRMILLADHLPLMCQLLAPQILALHLLLLLLLILMLVSTVQLRTLV